jgi:hypothetical protein
LSFARSKRPVFQTRLRFVIASVSLKGSFPFETTAFFAAIRQRWSKVTENFDQREQRRAFGGRGGPINATIAAPLRFSHPKRRLLMLSENQYCPPCMDWNKYCHVESRRFHEINPMKSESEKKIKDRSLHFLWVLWVTLRLFSWYWIYKTSDDVLLCFF